MIKIKETTRPRKKTATIAVCVTAEMYKDLKKQFKEYQSMETQIAILIDTMQKYDYENIPEDDIENVVLLETVDPEMEAEIPASIVPSMDEPIATLVRIQYSNISFMNLGDTYRNVIEDIKLGMVQNVRPNRSIANWKETEEIKCVL